MDDEEWNLGLLFPVGGVGGVVAVVISTGKLGHKSRVLFMTRRSNI